MTEWRYITELKRPGSGTFFQKKTKKQKGAIRAHGLQLRSGF